MFLRVFFFTGTNVYAHKCVLAARCEVMAAMFSGNFVETRSNKTEVRTIPCLCVQNIEFVAARTYNFMFYKCPCQKKYCT